ncbi:hypothetical protein HanIR_Chr14g0710561 [Helianthus annuus]|nr:hypothetical protein HanIR_Chr14g0710561 [Helianthus annuus]
MQLHLTQLLIKVVAAVADGGCDEGGAWRWRQVVVVVAAAVVVGRGGGCQQRRAGAYGSGGLWGGDGSGGLWGGGGWQQWRVTSGSNGGHRWSVVVAGGSESGGLWCC